MESLIGVNNKMSDSSKTQVYYATYGKEGTRLPCLNRSFISFSYGGKWIEDFNLIVTTNDRINKKLTADFQDITSSYEVINGQYYWGTYFKQNELSFTLSTDGISEKKLNEFINWFHPGRIEELILAEHPNRAIMARISESPNMNMIPFEEKINVIINEQKYTTSTTLYKGDITINFVMDEPFWYSKKNLLTLDENNNKDFFKIIAEDNIPCLEMITDETIIFGDEEHCSINNFSSGEENANYLYYAGSAPGEITLTFSLRPIIVEGTFTYSNNIYEYNFLQTPRSTSDIFINKEYAISISEENCNKIFFETEDIQELLIGAPMVYKEYNKIICLILDFNTLNFYDLRRKIRENIKHKNLKNWAFMVLNYCEEKSFDDEDYNIEKLTGKNKLIEFMKYFFMEVNNNEFLNSTFMFDIKNKQYYGIIGYRLIEENPPLEDNDFIVYGTINNQKEDISDMLLSDCPLLNRMNHFSEDGKIKCWTESDKLLTYRIYHNFENNLTNVSIKFKNQYY